MSTKIKAGLLLPAGTAVNPEPIFVEDYKSIQQYVGGAFDCVVTNLGKDDVSFLGYVNDEGLILDMEFNYIASALFQRELRGDCVLLWGLSPEGEYDGEDYDLPEQMTKFVCGTLMDTVAVCYGQSALLSIFCDIAVEVGLYTKDEVMTQSFELAEASSRGDYEAREKILEFFTSMIKTIIGLNLGDESIETVGNMLIEDLESTLKKGQ